MDVVISKLGQVGLWVVYFLFSKFIGTAKINTSELWGAD
jgi:hypothetical protein